MNAAARIDCSDSSARIGSIGNIGSIGLTGGIGSGKSTVAQLLVAHGAMLVDTDAIARALTLPGGAAIAPIAARFGTGMIASDGALDRERMRARVFADPGAKAQLEGILHPLIGQEADRQAAAAGGAVVVFDVPLLAESPRWRRRVARILVVDCSEATQCHRVMQRSGWSEETVRAVIAQQATRAQRRAIADAVIFNDGISPETLADEVGALWTLWCRERGKPL
ncbi:MAG: dephospho-CoA kinase [Burkholderiales bacterium]|nr:dephospho-CoA kinase [Burkholderiales bacterium]